MDKLNLTPTINLQRSDKDGKHAIRIRSTVKRKVSYYSTGISVLENQFRNKEIVNHPNKNLLNASIRSKMNEIEKGVLEGSLNIKTDANFYQFCENKIEQQKSQDSLGTYRHKLAYLTKLKKFKSRLQFSEINPSFMLDYENFCREKGNKPTTVWSSIKFIRTMVNAGLNDGVITGNPLRKFKGQSYVNPERSFLTDEEIERIEKFAATSKRETLVKVANWFLFGCYTGLRYADVKNFDKSKIVGERIILRTEKKKTDVSIKLHEKLRSVLDKIEPGVFTNQKMNEYLKIIAEKCEIDKSVTCHTSRHSFAVYWLTKGGSIESLSKILGHSSIKTTQIYGKVIDLKIDTEMDKVWQR